MFTLNSPIHTRTDKFHRVGQLATIYNVWQDGVLGFLVERKGELGVDILRLIGVLTRQKENKLAVEYRLG